ncbi:Deleted in lung and esophageal cancer protein 1 [Phlyctochytrium bullatum]|nr:Deleted in lung and esophageal cancer protein 1 [Phlyctochytrium bullatum]
MTTTTSSTAATPALDLARARNHHHAQDTPSSAAMLSLGNGNPPVLPSAARVSDFRAHSKNPSEAAAAAAASLDILITTSLSMENISGNTAPVRVTGGSAGDLKQPAGTGSGGDLQKMQKQRSVGRSTSLLEPRNLRNIHTSHETRSVRAAGLQLLSAPISKLQSKSLPSLAPRLDQPLMPLEPVETTEKSKPQGSSRLTAELIKSARSSSIIVADEQLSKSKKSLAPLPASKIKLRNEALALKKAYETALKEAHDVFVAWEEDQQRLLESTALKFLDRPKSPNRSSTATKPDVIPEADKEDITPGQSALDVSKPPWLRALFPGHEDVTEESVIKLLSGWLSDKGHTSVEPAIQSTELKTVLDTFIEERRNVRQYVIDLEEKISSLDQFVAKIERGDRNSNSDVRKSAESREFNFLPVSSKNQHAADRVFQDYTGGLFEAIPNIFIKRSLNGKSLKPWLIGKGFADSIHKPGILETEADYIVTRLGSLEPSRPPPPDRLNKMHPFTDDEIDLIESMASRIKFLRNPRFPRNLPDPQFVANLRSLPSYSRAHGHQGVRHGRPIDGRVVATPESLYFTDYEPHKPYMKYLTIRNKTPHATRFRLSTLPPYRYSKYFQIRLKTTPTEFNGLVASGMSVTYEVVFIPDSLADFELILQVSTEIGLGTPEGNFCFTVPIIARREPPELTLCDVLHCGPCRAGYLAIRRWTFRNIGGPGKFLIVRQEDPIDPYHMFEDLRQRVAAGETVHMPPVRQGPFEIFPALFGVEAGASAEITVTYRAMRQDLSSMNNGDGVRERLDAAVVKIACDNCQVLELPIYGVSQSPCVEIVSCTAVEPASVMHLPTMRDGTTLTFHRQNILATTVYSMRVFNNTRIKLLYKWITFDNPGEGLSVEGATWDDVQQNPSFTFEPARGCLHPNSEFTFKVRFTPHLERHYNVCAKLLLLDDDDRVDADGNVHPKLNAGSRDLESAIEIKLTGEGIPYELYSKPEIVLFPGSLYMGSRRTSRVQLVNRSMSDIPYTLRTKNIDSRLLHVELVSEDGDEVVHAGSAKTILIHAVGLFPCKIKGDAFVEVLHGLGGEVLLYIPILLTVEVRPGALDFKTPYVDFGLIALGSSSSVSVPLENRSNIPFRWRLSMVTAEADAQRGAPAAAAVQGSGDESASPSKPAQDKHMEVLEDKLERWRLEVQPCSGVIQPGAVESCRLTFIPSTRQRHRGILSCEILPLDTEDDNAWASSGPPVLTACIESRAEVQAPAAVLLNGINSLSCFLNVPFTWKITLANVTHLSANFTWDRHPYLGNNPTPNPDIDVHFGTAEGRLGPCEHLEIPVTLCFTRQETFRAVKLRCRIADMLERDGWLEATLDVNVYGLRVKFRILGGEGAEHPERTNAAPVEPADRTTLRRLSLKPVGRKSNFVDRTLWPDGGPYTIDFGVDCPIFANRVRTLVIRNRTAIASPFRTWVETYTATGLDDEEEEVAGKKDKAQGKDSETSGKLILKPSKKEKIGFSSDVGKAWIESTKAIRRTIARMNHLLREGRGVAFHTTPSHGVIEPFGEVRITLTSYNNLVGQYEDRFVVEIGGKIRETIPIYLGVDGLPVRFIGAQLMAAKSSDKLNRLNFGTRAIQIPDLSLIEKASKVIQVENLSPRTIHLKWKIYVSRQSRPSSPSHDSPTNRQNTDADQIMLPENEVDPSDPSCPLTLTPNPCTITAFKTAPIRIHFAASRPGLYQIMLASEVWYVQPTGSLSLSPILSDKGLTPMGRPSFTGTAPGAQTAHATTGHQQQDPQQPQPSYPATQPPTQASSQYPSHHPSFASTALPGGSTSRQLGVTNLAAALANNPLLQAQPSRPVTLLVLGKLVEPTLVLEDGNDVIILRPPTPRAAPMPATTLAGQQLLQDLGHSVISEPPDLFLGRGFRAPTGGWRQAGGPAAAATGEDAVPQVIVLQNGTDASCEFSISVDPPNRLRLLRAEVAATPAGVLPSSNVPAQTAPGALAPVAGSTMSMHGLASRTLWPSRTLGAPRTVGDYHETEDPQQDTGNGPAPRRHKRIGTGMSNEKVADETFAVTHELHPNEKVVVLVQFFPSAMPPPPQPEPGQPPATADTWAVSDLTPLSVPPASAPESSTLQDPVDPTPVFTPQAASQEAPASVPTTAPPPSRGGLGSGGKRDDAPASEPAASVVSTPPVAAATTTTTTAPTSAADRRKSSSAARRKTRASTAGLRKPRTVPDTPEEGSGSVSGTGTGTEAAGTGAPSTPAVTAPPSAPTPKPVVVRTLVGHVVVHFINGTVQRIPVYYG